MARWQITIDGEKLCQECYALEAAFQGMQNALRIKANPDKVNFGPKGWEGIDLNTLAYVYQAHVEAFHFSMGMIPVISQYIEEKVEKK